MERMVITMKKNGWKIVPLLLALILAASFLGCSKDEKENDQPTVGQNMTVEQYTFDGISSPSTTAENTQTSKSSSGSGSYIGSGNSYLGGYQAANRLPTAAPYGGSGSSSTTKASTAKKPSDADLSKLLSGFNGSLSMSNIGEIKNFLLKNGIDADAMGIDIAQFISGLVDAKENGEKPDAGNILDEVSGILGNLGSGETTKSGS